MNSVANHTGVPAAPTQAARVSILRVVFLESRMEFLRLLRNPSFSVPIIAFPLMFYVLFAIVLGPPSAAGGVVRHMLATYTVFGAMAPGLFGLGVTLAMDRDRGLLELKRALPMPAGAYLAAKVAMSAVFAAIVSLLLMAIAATAGQVVLEVVQWGELLLVAVLGVLPFCSLGLLIGTLVKGQAAPAVINLIYLPMSFLSGLLFPLSMLPHSLLRLAPFWPSYQLAQIAQIVVDNDRTHGLAAHVLAVAAEGVVFFALARRRLANLR